MRVKAIGDHHPGLIMTWQNENGSFGRRVHELYQRGTERKEPPRVDTTTTRFSRYRQMTTFNGKGTGSIPELFGGTDQSVWTTTKYETSLITQR